MRQTRERILQPDNEQQVIHYQRILGTKVWCLLHEAHRVVLRPVLEDAHEDEVRVLVVDEPALRAAAPVIGRQGKDCTRKLYLTPNVVSVAPNVISAVPIVVFRRLSNKPH